MTSSHEDVKKECLQFFQNNPFSMESAASLQRKLGRKQELLCAILEELAAEGAVRVLPSGMHPLYQLQQAESESGPGATAQENSSDLSFPRLNQLTKREKDIVKLLLQGKNNQDVAEILFISPNTVKNHITNIYAKLQVSDRYELMSRLYQWSGGDCLF